MENYEEIIKYLRSGETTDKVDDHTRKISEAIERNCQKDTRK
jgi:hypothetical protein